MSRHTVQLTVNGEPQEVEAPARRLLSDLLRDDLHLTGTKRGCETAICGACTVLIDGEPVKSCLMLAVQARGREVTTIEGVHGDNGELDPIQQAFVENGALQCGYCTPGFIMTTRAFLAKNPQPTRAQVREALSGNLCRCTGYMGIVDAVLDAARRLSGDRSRGSS